MKKNSSFSVNFSMRSMAISDAPGNGKKENGERRWGWGLILIRWVFMAITLNLTATSKKNKERKEAMVAGN